MGKGIEQKGVSPEELFTEILLELHGRGNVRFHVNLGKWHWAFYGAKSKYPQFMGAFESLVGKQLYVHVITECFHEFVQAGHLSRVIPDNDYLINNPESIRKNWNPNPQVQEIARHICDKIYAPC